MEGTASMPKSSETWDDKKFDEFIHSPVYQAKEKKIRHRVDNLRKSNDFNDDDCDYAIVVVLETDVKNAPISRQAKRADPTPSSTKLSSLKYSLKPASSVHRSADAENVAPNRRMISIDIGSKPGATRSERKAERKALHRKTRRVLRDIVASVASQIRPLLDRLHAAGLRVKVDSHAVDDRLMLKVLAKPSRLEEEAERVGLKVEFADGRFATFERRLRDDVKESPSDPSNLFRSSQRQELIAHILKSAVSDGGVGIDSFPQVEKIFPLHMKARLRTLKHCWLKYWDDSGTAEAGKEEEGGWKPAWFWRMSSMPLDRIAAYFGEDAAFYHAWMALLTTWLVFPSVLGIILFSYQVFLLNILPLAHRTPSAEH
jgi:hypothetical protein